MGQEAGNKSKSTALKTVGKTGHGVSDVVMLMSAKGPQVHVLPEPLQAAHIFLHIDLNLDFHTFLALGAFLFAH